MKVHGDVVDPTHEELGQTIWHSMFVLVNLCKFCTRLKIISSWFQLSE